MKTSSISDLRYTIYARSEFGERDSRRQLVNRKS